jgi:hypothetical protein
MVAHGMPAVHGAMIARHSIRPSVPTSRPKRSLGTSRLARGAGALDAKSRGRVMVSGSTDAVYAPHERNAPNSP